MISINKIIILVFVLLVCIGCDQGTKYTAKHFLADQAPMSFAGDTFRLTYTENSGAFLSLGADLPAHFRQILFVFLTAIFLIVFLIFILRSRRLSAIPLYSSALIIGGGVGNLIDRVINDGAVIDFMNIGIGSIRTGIFNVADLAITAGVLFFAISIYKEEQSHH